MAGDAGSHAVNAAMSSACRKRLVAVEKHDLLFSLEEVAEAVAQTECSLYQVREKLACNKDLLQALVITTFFSSEAGGSFFEELTNGQMLGTNRFASSTVDAIARSFLWRYRARKMCLDLILHFRFPSLGRVLIQKLQV